MTVSGRNKMQSEYVERRLTGVICERCGVTLQTYVDCPADLDDPCPGFVNVDKAKQDFNAMFYDSVLGK